MSSKDLKNMMAAMSMSKEEIETFLSVSRMARMATTSSNGKPHLVPVWYYYDGTNILVTATKGTKRTKNVKNNPNVSIVIDIVEGKAEDISYLNAKAVVIEGEAEIRDDTDGAFASIICEYSFIFLLVSHSTLTWIALAWCLISLLVGYWLVKPFLL